MQYTPNEWSLASLIERGGVYYDLPGEKMKEFLAGLVDALPPVPSLDTGALYREILERETLMSTGTGRGIALPHPRNPMLGENGSPLVAIAFPRNIIDWNSPDGNGVHTVFLLVSVSAKQHLNTLSKINFLCQQEKFYSLIKARSPAADIIAAIREAETAWGKN
jgi:PTS system nitrogen regulatory IIA component